MVKSQAGPGYDPRMSHFPKLRLRKDSAILGKKGKRFGVSSNPTLTPFPSNGLQAFHVPCVLYLGKSQLSTSFSVQGNYLAAIQRFDGIYCASAPKLARKRLIPLVADLLALSTTNTGTSCSQRLASWHRSDVGLGSSMRLALPEVTNMVREHPHRGR